MSQIYYGDVYELDTDLSRFEMQDFEYDLEVSQEVLENIFWKSQIDEIKLLNLPNPIICEAEPGFIQYVDYAHTNFYLDGVMSKRMLEVLQSVKPFECRVYPIEAVDFVTFPVRNLAPNNDFVAVQMTEYLDIFDYESSVYTKHKYTVPRYNKDTGEEEWFVSDIKHLVLKKPIEGYPPIFRIDENPVTLYISDEARQALKSAKITGVSYVDINGYANIDTNIDIDVPLIMPDWDTREAEWRDKMKRGEV
jgi:hypothetical protein